MTSVVTASILALLTAARNEAPLYRNSTGDEMVRQPALTYRSISRMLSRDAYSKSVGPFSGLNRYDGAQLATNWPCEDTEVHGRFSSPWNDGQDWIALGVFDGHSGPHTAEVLQDQLLRFVKFALYELSALSTEAQPLPAELIQNAIQAGFLHLDDTIFMKALKTLQGDDPLPDKIQQVQPAFSGSCALLSLFDPTSNLLHVANTGDSRAVLGQKGLDDKWRPVQLSEDQTGHNHSEAARIHCEHPGEANLTQGGHVLGLRVSRAFGDGPWKWPLDLYTELVFQLGGPFLSKLAQMTRTPPYITAEPVVTSTRISPGRASFLIQATDGFWDLISNQDAINLVGEWLESHIKRRRRRRILLGRAPFDFTCFWRSGVNWRFCLGRTTAEDDNAAVYLLRNTLGGNHRELLASRLAWDSTFSRHIQDDITVQVIFFNLPEVMI